MHKNIHTRENTVFEEKKLDAGTRCSDHKLSNFTYYMITACEKS